MSSDNLAQRGSVNLHFAIVSLTEELDAINWYRQRADDAEDETLKDLLLHNMEKTWSMPQRCSNGLATRRRPRTVAEDLPFH